MKASLPILAVLSSTALAAPVQPTPTVSVYRFDVSIAGIEPSPATYTLILAEDRPGQVHSGPNIAYVSGSAGAVQREQLGVDLGLRYVERNGVLLVEGDFSMRSVVAPTGPNPSWAKVGVGDVVVPVTPGKPTLFTSVYDLAAHKRYEVTVTAQRVL
jgi:hypothetical protein